ncbi:MAG: branched-chain amino acid transport system permease protein [Tepidanaerobacteraceae bacterium]|nr:branched-chain amino acid transport system permease protein [Tepidanaerobacteraceae bacterium]
MVIKDLNTTIEKTSMDKRMVNWSDRIFEVFEDTKVKTGISTLLIVTSLALPYFASNYVLEILTNAYFYMILCLGLNIVVGFAGLLDLGYAAFFAVGAYTTGILSTRLGINFWLTIPFSILFSAIAGIIIGGPTLRLRSDYLAIVTLGFGEIIRIAARNLKITGGASGLVGIERPIFFGMKLYQNQHFYYIFLLLVFLAVFVSYRLHNSRLGRAWEYIREDEDAAEAMGIDRVKFKLYAYITGAIFAGIAGSFYAVKMTSISPETFQFTQSVNILAAVVLGGMGKIPGVIMGAFILVMFPEIFRSIGNMRMLVFGIILLIIMIFRPHGLWPEKNN